MILMLPILGFSQKNNVLEVMTESKGKVVWHIWCFMKEEFKKMSRIVKKFKNKNRVVQKFNKLDKNHHLLSV